MTKYLTRSADVLNAADRLEDIMAWQLFTYEQDALLWGYSKESTWVPGDPLHYAYYDEYDCRWYAQGNHSRPMFELFSSDMPHGPFASIVVRCWECEVTWVGSAPCWVCGNGRYLEKSEMWWALKGTLETYLEREASEEAVDNALIAATERAERMRQLRAREAQYIEQWFDGWFERAQRSVQDLAHSMNNVHIAFETFSTRLVPLGRAVRSLDLSNNDSAPYWSISLDTESSIAVKRQPFVMPDFGRRYDPLIEVGDPKLLKLSTKLKIQRVLAGVKCYQRSIAEPVISRGNPHLEAYLAREKHKERPRNQARGRRHA